MLFRNNNTKLRVKVTFSLPEFVSTHGKPVYCIHSSLTYSQFKKPENRVITPIFDRTHANISLSSDFYQSLSTCRKIRLFHHFVLDIYGIIYKPDPDSDPKKTGP